MAVLAQVDGAIIDSPPACYRCWKAVMREVEVTLVLVWSLIEVAWAEVVADSATLHEVQWKGVYQTRCNTWP